MNTLLNVTKTKSFLLVALVVLISSCKSTKVITDGKLDSRLSSKSVIKAHYQNQANFKTLKGRLAIGYSDGASSKNVNVSFRMEKDKAIWMSAPLSIVKVYITPTRVSFYNKLQNEYFDGDFSYLSDLLGTDVDFSILQNLLLGQAIANLQDQKYSLDMVAGTYQLTPKVQGTLYKSLFQIEPKTYKIGLQQLSQPAEKRLLEIAYQNYQVVDNETIPNEIKVKAISGDETNTIDLEYRNIELNGPVNFPYKIPKGFKEVQF